MRCAYRDAFTVTQDEKVIGVCLSADFCAEHEHGIDRLKDSFQCDGKKPGLYGCKVKKDSSKSGSITIDGIAWHYVASEEIAEKSYVAKWPTIVDEELKVNLKVGWDQQGFAVLSDDKALIDIFVDAFKRKDVTLSVGASKAFKNGGLFILVYSKIPKDWLTTSAKSSKDYDAAKKALKTSKAFKKLEKRQAEWRERYPFSRETPFSYFALAPHGDSYWLNPHGQKYLHWGSVTLQDIEDWADEKVGTVIFDAAKWEDLKFECSIPLSTYGLGPDGCYRKAFARLSIDDYLEKRQNEFKVRVFRKRNPETGLLEMDEESKRYVLTKIRYQILDDLFSQIGIYSITETDPARKRQRFDEFCRNATENLYPRQRVLDEVFGILETLYMLDVGAFHGSTCSVSENIEDKLSLVNMSNLREIIVHEALYDVLEQCGRLPEHWKIVD